MANQQLVDYIKQQLAQNVSKEAIKISLMTGGGWSSLDIDEALLSLETKTNRQNMVQPGKKQLSFKVIFSVCILIILVSAVLYIYFQKYRTIESDNMPQDNPNNQIVGAQVDSLSTTTSLNNPISSVQRYYLYTNPIIPYSLELPEGWGVVDQDVNGKYQKQLDIISPSNNNHFDLKTTEQVVSIISAATGDIQISTITPTQANFEKSWNMTKSNGTEITVPDTSKFVKGVVSWISEGPLDNCTGIGYTILATKRIYSITACSKNESERDKLKVYLDRIVQTLVEKD